MPNMWILIVSSGSPYPQETVDILFSKTFSSLINWLLPVHFMARYCKRFLLHSKSWIFFFLITLSTITYLLANRQNESISSGGDYRRELLLAQSQGHSKLWELNNLRSHIRPLSCTCMDKWASKGFYFWWHVFQIRPQWKYASLLLGFGILNQKDPPLQQTGYKASTGSFLAIQRVWRAPDDLSLNKTDKAATGGRGGGPYPVCEGR